MSYWRGKSGHWDIDGNEALSDGIDTKTEAFEGHRPEQRRRVRFAEDDECRCLATIISKLRSANATHTSPSIGKDAGPFIKVGDSQRIEHI